jgi:glycosyltransferase involved in cell wall biosynthesis
MKLSIAMTTYNGSRFVGEQLESFASQTRLPDELIVCDDSSTDHTPEILREFQRRSPFLVRIIVNQRQLGFIKNFEQAVRETSGDVVLLSDHDDRWNPEKLAEHEAAHASRPSVGFVFSNGMVCDESMNPRGLTLFEVTGLRPSRYNKIEQGKMLELVVRGPRVHGCMMSFRSSLKEIALPFPESIIHDFWLALLLPLFTETRCIAKPLIMYRTHTIQTVGVHQDRKGWSAPVATEINAMEVTLERFRQFESIAYRKDAGRVLEGKIAHLQARSKLDGSFPSRVLVLGSEVLNGNYWRYSTKSTVKSDIKRCLSLPRTPRSLAPGDALEVDLGAKVRPKT